MRQADADQGQDRVRHGCLIQGAGIDPFMHHDPRVLPQLPGKLPVSDITRSEPTEALQRSKIRLLHTLDRGVLGRMGLPDGEHAAGVDVQVGVPYPGPDSGFRRDGCGGVAAGIE